MPQVMVTGDVSRDEQGHVPLTTPIGPFPSREAAESFMKALGPLWGSWDTTPLYDPFDVIRAVPR